MRGVWRTPGVAQLVAAQLLARMPQGMLSLAVLIHARIHLHNYTAAGACVAVFAIGAAFAGPFVSRLMLVLGVRPALGWFVLADTIAMVAFAVVPAGLVLSLVLAALMGFFSPPVLPAVRSIYPRLVSPLQLNMLYSIDSSLQELIWVVGPVVVTFTAAAFGSQLALIVTAVLGAAGGVWLICTRAVKRVQLPPAQAGLGSVLRKWPVLVLIAATTLLVMGYGAIEAAILAAFPGWRSGMLLAVLSIGSVMGGIIMGTRPMRRSSAAARIGLVGFGTLMIALWMNPIWVASWMLIAGLGTAPALGVCYAMLSSSLKLSDTPEAFAWLSTGQTVGAGIGTGLAGYLLDTASPTIALLLAAGLTFAGALCALGGMRVLPDLRAGSGPLLDTSAVPVIGRSTRR